VITKRSEKIAELLVSAILIIGIVGTLIRDAHLLFSFPIPVGTDGFYYLNQIESIRSTGELCYPSVSPLLLYIFGLLSRAFVSPVLTIKAGALFLLGALLIAAGRFVTILTGERFFGLVAAALILASNTHLYFIVEFLNNLAALSLLILGAGSLLKARVLTGSILIALAAATHSSVPLVISTAIIFALIAIGCTNPGVIVPTVALAWAATPFTHFAHPITNPLQGDTKLDVLVAILISLVSLALFSFASDVTVRRRTAARICILVSSIATFAITLNPFLDRTTGIESIGGRVSLLAPLQTAMVLPVIVFAFGLKRWTSVSICLVAFLAISLMNFGRSLPAGISPRVLARKTQLMNTLRNWHLPSDSLVIAAHGDQFLVSHALRIDSASRFAPAQDKAKVWWLLRGPEHALHHLAILTNSGRRSSDCVLVEDSKLRTAFGTLSSRDQFVVLAANPHLRKELNQGLDSELNRLRYQ